MIPTSLEINKARDNIKVGDAVLYIKRHEIERWAKSNTKKVIHIVSKVFKHGNRVSVSSLLNGIEFDTNILNVIPFDLLESVGLVTSDNVNQESLNIYKETDISTKEDHGIFYGIDKPIKWNPRAEISIERRDGRALDANTYRFNNKPIKSKKMKINKTVGKVMDSNVTAAKSAATIAAGKTLNKLLVSKLKPQLPMLVRGYADSAFADVVVANMAMFAVQQFAADNEKAAFAANAMMQAAMVDLLSSFNIDDIISDLLSNVSLPEVGDKA